ALASETDEDRAFGEVEVCLVDTERHVTVAAEDRVGLVFVDLSAVDELVGVRDGARIRESLRDASLQAVQRPLVLTRAVVVDAVVEAPQREAKSEVVEPRLVAREPRVELRIEEVAVLDELQRRPCRRRLDLRLLRRERPLGIEARANLEVVVAIE